MFRFEKIWQWLRAFDGEEEQDDLSPTCRKLLEMYYLDTEGSASEVLALGIYPQSETVVVVFYAVVLRSPPAFSSKSYADRNIKVTFSGATDAQASLDGNLLPHGELCDLRLGSIDELEIKGNCRHSPNTEDYHVHTLRLGAGELSVRFTFDDLTFEEVAYFRPD